MASTYILVHIVVSGVLYNVISLPLQEKTLRIVFRDAFSFNKVFLGSSSNDALQLEEKIKIVKVIKRHFKKTTSENEVDKVISFIRKRFFLRTSDYGWIQERRQVSLTLCKSDEPIIRCK